MKFALAALPVLLALNACTPVSSDSLLTSGIYAEVTVDSTGDGTASVTTYLKAGGDNGTFVDLADGDSLTAVQGTSEPVTLDKQELFGIYTYLADLPSDDPAQAVTVSFNRTLDAGAPNTVVNLPEAFDADEPVATSPRSADLVLGWSAGSDDSMAIDASGNCINTFDEDVDDLGHFTIPSNALTPISGQETASCALTITLTRSRAGTLDPAYGSGGAATGTQTRTVSVTSTP